MDCSYLLACPPIHACMGGGSTLFGRTLLTIVLAVQQLHLPLGQSVGSLLDRWSMWDLSSSGTECTVAL